MLRALIAAVVGTIPSLALILWIERRARRLVGGPLAWWRRLLIPLPIIFTLASVTAPVLVSRTFHLPWESMLHHGFLGWGVFACPYAAMLLVALLPFILAGSMERGGRLIPIIWGGHAAWVLFPLAPWLTMTGC